MKSILLLACLVFASCCLAAGKEKMPCDADSQCSDGCIHFAKDVVFAETPNDRAVLRYEGIIHHLKLISRKDVKKRQFGADLPGDVAVAVYSGDKFRIELTTTTRHTSCYVKQPDNSFQSIDTDCGGDSDVALKVFLQDGTRQYKTNWRWGC